MMIDLVAFASFAAFTAQRQRDYSTSFNATSTKLHEAALEAAVFNLRVQGIAFVPVTIRWYPNPRPTMSGGMHLVRKSRPC